jgi:hypothetical protein
MSNEESKLKVQEDSWVGVKWPNLTQARDQLRRCVNGVMNCSLTVWRGQLLDQLTYYYLIKENSFLYILWVIHFVWVYPITCLLSSVSRLNCIPSLRIQETDLQQLNKSLIFHFVFLFFFLFFVIFLWLLTSYICLLAYRMIFDIHLQKRSSIAAKTKV